MLSAPDFCSSFVFEGKKLRELSAAKLETRKCCYLERDGRGSGKGKYCCWKRVEIGKDAEREEEFQENFGMERKMQT